VPGDGNDLAVVAVELTRDLSAVRFLHAAERDYTAWLQREVCRARQWTVPDVIRAWHDELDRREHGRAIVRGAREAA
jgi:hypothetical protein